MAFHKRIAGPAPQTQRQDQADSECDVGAWLRLPLLAKEKTVSWLAPAAWTCSAV